MTKNEFFDYVKYLDKLFNTNNSDDKEVLATWYKSFEHTHLKIAKEMAQMYLQEEQGRFKLAKLLQYKSKAMAGKTYFTSDNKKEVCPLCGGCGYVQVEVPYRKISYTRISKRCLCAAGERLSKDIIQITRQEISEGILRSGVVRHPELYNNEVDSKGKFKSLNF